MKGGAQVALHFMVSTFEVFLVLSGKGRYVVIGMILFNPPHPDAIVLTDHKRFKFFTGNISIVPG